MTLTDALQAIVLCSGGVLALAWPWLRKGFEGVNERIHDGEITDG